ncbi:Ig domain-containing protein [Phenylobacterium sp.]|uniref:Ig domain-containing protein n=1 Tax=Phenylobacterium sp. TaxID=1871053 RepID=UPI002FC5B3D0
MTAYGSIGVNSQAGNTATSKARVFPVLTGAPSAAHNTTLRKALGYRANTLPGGNSFPVPLNATLPPGAVATTYTTTLSAKGGSSPYSFSVTAGSLPSGLSLSGSTGVISGTPTALGTGTFTIQVTDANLVTGSQVFSLFIGAAGGSGNSGFSN